MQGSLFASEREEPASPSQEALLDRYRSHRLEDGASPRTAASEVSQLRALGRDLASSGRARALVDVLNRPELAGACLLDPQGEVSRSTIRTRYRAVQRLLGFEVAPEVASRRLQRLDASLGRKSSRGWHDPGVVVGGRKERARARPTLPTSALAEIFEVAEGDSAQSAALAALLCYTGIPIDDVCRLRWCELTWGRDALDCEVRLGAARDRRVYVVMGPGVAAILRLRLERADEDLAAFLFRGRRAGTAVTSRAVSGRLTRWARRAGYGSVRRHEVTAALAAWLSENRVDDASIQQVLGRRWTKSVDALLAPYKRLEGQERVQEVLERRLDSPGTN